MKNNTKPILVQQTTNKAISLTTYRSLFIVKELSLEAKSAEELAKACLNDKILCRSLTKETIANTINTLREAGFEIEKPKPSNDYKYKLLNSPLKYSVTEETAENLNTLRESVYYLNDYELVLKINSVYEKIFQFTNCEKYADLLEKSNHLKNINTDILKKIIDLCNEKAEARIIYNSPENGNEELKIKAQKIVFENNRLYLWLYNYKYQTPAYLRIDKIIDIKRTESKSDGKDCILSCLVEYELIGEAAKNFIPLQNEIITQKLIDKIIVQANVINSFNFFQRIIGFADECKILSPQSLQKAYLSRIDKILGVYNDDK